MASYEAVIMSKSILFWRIAFLLRDISVFSKYRLCQLSFKACWMNLARDTMCLTTSSRPEEGRKQPNFIPQQNKMYPPILEKREVGSFRNLTWLNL